MTSERKLGFSLTLLDKASALSFEKQKLPESANKTRSLHCVTPLGYHCRQRLIKQNKLSPTVPRVERSDKFPGPQHSSINVPALVGGLGHSHIRRAPAYTFGHSYPAEIRKPSTNPGATVLSLRGFRAKDGLYKIKHGVISDLPHDPYSIPLPGPGQYRPKFKYAKPVAPKYTMAMAKKPQYQSPDSWSPSANMYHPPLDPGPAYTVMGRWRDPQRENLPGPGAYNEKYHVVYKTIPSYSHGIRRALPNLKKHVPAPNLYCHKKFRGVLGTIPAPTFGIKHSPYIATGIAAAMPEDLRLKVQCDNQA